MRARSEVAAAGEVPGSGENHRLGQWQKRARMESTSLSAMMPITRNSRPLPPDARFQGLGQGEGGGGVVGPVQKDAAVLGHLFQAPRPTGIRQAFPDGRLADGQPRSSKSPRPPVTPRHCGTGGVPAGSR